MVPRHSDRTRHEAIELAKHHDETGAQNHEKAAPRGKILHMGEPFGGQLDEGAEAHKQPTAAEMSDQEAGAVAQHGAQKSSRKHVVESKIAPRRKERCRNQRALAGERYAEVTRNR